MARIFISRESEYTEIIKSELGKKGHDLISASCILTQSVPFQINESFDWIFFSSSTGVKHFLPQFPNEHSGKIGVMGMGTLRALPAHWHAEFIGKTTQPEAVAREFMMRVKPHEKILFPVGKQSLKSIAHYFNADQVKIIEVYETQAKKTIVPHCDVYIFSSPSNFNSFIQYNTIPTTAAIISFGPSTSQEIFNANYPIQIELQQVDEKNIVDTIFSLIGS
jgi:uroporphyrinogen-III synthase